MTEKVKLRSSDDEMFEVDKEVAECVLSSSSQHFSKSESRGNVGHSWFGRDTCLDVGLAVFFHVLIFGLRICFAILARKQ